METASGTSSWPKNACTKHRILGGFFCWLVALGMPRKLADTAADQAKNNVAFMAYFLQGKIDKCLELLCATGRYPEAAFFARTYIPSRISEVVQAWKENLGKISKKAAEALADPAQYENLFVGLKDTFKAEEYLKTVKKPYPSTAYGSVTNNSERNVLEEIKQVIEGGTFSEATIDASGDAAEEQASAPAEETPAAAAPAKSATPPSEDNLDLDLDDLNLDDDVDLDTGDVNLDEDDEDFF